MERRPFRYRDGRKSQLVVDTGIIDNERCGEKPVANDFVRRRKGR